MKYLKIIYILTIIVVFSACKDFTDLDLRDNPSAVRPDQAEPDFLYNSIALNFNNFYFATYNNTSTLTRMRGTAGGFTYNNSFQATNFNGIWNIAYAGLLPDFEALEAQAAEKGLDYYSGTIKVLKAFTLITLVDYFGDVPYSQATKGLDNISPKADKATDVYAAAETILNEAIATLQNVTETSPKPAIDMYYDGDAAKWITLAKTLKLKMYLTTRLVDNGAKDKINALLAEDDLIDAANEDFQFNYGSQRNNPNSRHPNYSNVYESNDGDYMANYYMWLLYNEKGIEDPRIRFYFYRQDRDQSDDDPNVWSCIFSEIPDDAARPAHYAAVDPDMPYCSIGMTTGYYGRDHLNGAGIPPDGPIRTVYGLYPAAGKFDDNSFKFMQNEGIDGGKGEGINPFILSSYVDFMRAEGALMLGTSDNAKEKLESGIRKSIAKVLGFQSLTPQDFNRVVTDAITGEDKTIAQLFVPDAAAIDAYVTNVLDSYDAAANDDEKLDIIMKEYYIALWGNPMEAYNNYRRTGKPANMQPAIEPTSGEFLRSALYPANYVNLNANAKQKVGNVQVFWDNNPATGFVY